MKLIERTAKEWTDFLNSCFDFGSYGVTKKGAKSTLAILLLVVIASALLLSYLASSPEQLPGT